MPILEQSGTGYGPSASLGVSAVDKPFFGSVDPHTVPGVVLTVGNRWRVTVGGGAPPPPPDPGSGLSFTTNLDSSIAIAGTGVASAPDVDGAYAITDAGVSGTANGDGSVDVTGV
jgi:hypothetical protein